jgi:uncharacterized protein
MNKVIYSNIFHKRLTPVVNQFSYRGVQVLVNIDQLDCLPGISLNKWGLISLHSKDHGFREKNDPNTGKSFRAWVNSKLKKMDIDIGGDIYLQTIPRIFGYAFNPVSFWYCYSGKKEEGKLKAIICEVNNTFGESHNYLLKIEDEKSKSILLPKEFYVSPFFERQGHYQFEIDKHISIKYFISGELQFLASLRPVKEVELSKVNLGLSLIKIPFFTFRVVYLIHWQALKLYVKKLKFINRPKAFKIKDTFIGSDQ